MATTTPDERLTTDAEVDDVESRLRRLEDANRRYSPMYIEWLKELSDELAEVKRVMARDRIEYWQLRRQLDQLERRLGEREAESTDGR